MKFTGKLAVLASLSLMVLACGEPVPETEVSTAEIRIEGAGATFPEPLYQEWIGRYETVNPEVELTYQGVGSGEGIKRFIANEVDFGASDAAMSDEEIARVDRGVKLIPATAGMVVLAYNIEGVGPGLKLPSDVYADIFLGKIWRWDDPRIVAANPGLDLPPKLIQLVSRRDSSGTTFVFSNHLNAISNAWRDGGPGAGKLLDWPKGTITGSGNSGVAQKIKISQGSIGYVEYGFARRLGLNMAILQNRSGEFVFPDEKSGQAALAAAAQENMPENMRLFLPNPGGADSYPIVGLSWILLYESYPDPKIAKALKETLAWELSAGQPIAEELGYVPLPQEIASKATAALESIR